jgi:hypothetical protein
MTKRWFILLLAVSSLVFSSGTALAQTQTTATTTKAAASTTTTTTKAAAPAKAKVPVRHAKVHATAKPPALPADTASLCVSGHTWKHWGAAPYAANREEAMTRLGNALDAMVTCGLMPKEVADAFRANDFKIIRDNPDGITTTPGKHAYLTPETHLDGMMTGGAHPHLMTDVTVDKTVIGKGQVKAAEALVWSLTLGNKTYSLIMPFTCFNWSLMTFEVKYAPPPATQDDCFIINAEARSADKTHQADKAIHMGMYGPYARSLCNAYQKVGETVWHPLIECDNCLYTAVTHEVSGPAGDLVLTIRARIPVTPGKYRIRVSRQYAESNLDVSVLCDERVDGTGSCGTKVQHSDYHHGEATIFYGRNEVPSDWSGRKLYWLFLSDIKKCFGYLDPLDRK